MTPKIGFLADLKARPKSKKHGTMPGLDSKGALILFDSGRGQTFEDARYHTVVFGTTGSGKTAAIILPAIARITEAGHSMIVCDIKGNLSEVRKFAKLYGRENDVVEYGCGPMAERRNVLASMDSNNVRKFFESLVKNDWSSDQDASWNLKGALIAADCVILLRFMAKDCPGLEPDLAMINEMINDQFNTCVLYTRFLEEVYDKENVGQRQFVTAIENNCFHFFRKLEKGLMGEFKMFEADVSYYEQVTWNMQGIRNAFAGIYGSALCYGAFRRAWGASL